MLYIWIVWLGQLYEWTDHRMARMELYANAGDEKKAMRIDFINVGKASSSINSIALHVRLAEWQSAHAEVNGVMCYNVL